MAEKKYSGKWGKVGKIKGRHGVSQWGRQVTSRVGNGLPSRSIPHFRGNIGNKYGVNREQVAGKAVAIRKKKGKGKKGRECRQVEERVDGPRTQPILPCLSCLSSPVCPCLSFLTRTGLLLGCRHCRFFKAQQGQPAAGAWDCSKPASPFPKANKSATMSHTRHKQQAGRHAHKLLHVGVEVGTLVGRRRKEPSPVHQEEGR